MNAKAGGMARKGVLSRGLSAVVLAGALVAGVEGAARNRPLPPSQAPADTLPAPRKDTLRIDSVRGPGPGPTRPEGAPPPPTQPRVPTEMPGSGRGGAPLPGGGGGGGGR